jgi:uncharacterized membrane-anchored protein YhcB (DUF1043 family)
MGSGVDILVTEEEGNAMKGPWWLYPMIGAIVGIAGGLLIAIRRFRQTNERNK